jgi:hypothetical protein
MGAMTGKEYVLERLAALKATRPRDLAADADKEELAKLIVRRLLSRKFRKYALKPELESHINEAVRRNIKAGDPIKLTFLNGCYKLWRLDESPEVDWAELFTLLHYADWLKEICAIYGPGVWFDFFEDDLIVPRLNGMSEADVEAYYDSFGKLMAFVNAQIPENLRFTLTRVGSQFKSKDEFFRQLDDNLKTVSAAHEKGFPTLNERQLVMIDLNARPELVRAEDPHWRERLYMLHDAYAIAKKGTGYHYVPEKILVFTQPLPNGMALAVGTVRSSVAKFWVGAGALARDARGDLYPVVLSPSQLDRAAFDWEPLELDGLTGKNFKRIRMLKG